MDFRDGIRRSARTAKKVYNFIDDDSPTFEELSPGFQPQTYAAPAMPPMPPFYQPQMPVDYRSISSQTIVDKGPQQQQQEDFGEDEEPEDEQDDVGSTYAPSGQSNDSPLDPPNPYNYPPSMHRLPYTQPRMMPSRPPPALYPASLPEELEDDDYLDDQSAPSTGPTRTKRGAKGAKGAGRNKDPNRVKRPPNAFILFRSHACAHNLIPQALRINDHRQISRIVATMWKALPPEEKSEWEEKARLAKEEHLRNHPDYRYKPIGKPNQPTRKPAKPKVKKTFSLPPTADQAKERRRCDVVARVLLENKQAGGTEDQLKVRISEEMRKASADHELTQEFQDEQRKLVMEAEQPLLEEEPRPVRQARKTPRKRVSESPLSEVSDGSRYDRANSLPQQEPHLSHSPELAPQAQPTYQAHWSESGYRSPYPHPQYSMPYGQQTTTSPYGAYGLAPPRNEPTSPYTARPFTGDPNFLAQYDVRRPSQVFRDTVAELGLNPAATLAVPTARAYEEARGYYPDRPSSQPQEPTSATLLPRFSHSAGPASPNSYGAPPRHSASPPVPFHHDHYTAGTSSDRFQNFLQEGSVHTQADWFNENSNPSTPALPQQAVA